MTVPEWAQDSVFYQIFPDRFENGDKSNDPINVRPWGSAPDSVHFQGGDLRGITNRLDYLSDFGITAIYLNPIFLSPSNHRYNIVDYYQIDPKLGTLADFDTLVNAVHQRGMHIILDGVFNHCGRGFFAFNDMLENGRESPYLDWFYVHRFPLDAYSSDRSRNYQAWWGIKSLPKFNTENPKVREFIFGVAHYWLERGADGWRLDVPNEIDDDDFWANFHDTVKQTNPEALLIGEIWEVQPRWVGDRHFDGLMNYPFRTAALDLVRNGKWGSEVAQQIRKVTKAYPGENLLSMYNLLGSHDTERIATMLSGRQDALRLAYLFLFALPGAPAIYYGDEIGLEGGKDPDCRRAFPWDQRKWNEDLRNWIKMLIQYRKQTIALRRGKIEIVSAPDNSQILVFERTFGNQSIYTVLNASNNAQKVQITLDNSVKIHEGTLPDALGQNINALVQDQNLTIELPPVSGAYFQTP